MEELYYPEGTASHLFENCFFDYIESQISKKKIRISIGAQPNESPHIGTLVLFINAFVLAKTLMQRDETLKCVVVFEMVDTAPFTTELINGKLYQINIRDVGNPYYKEYVDLLDFLSVHTKVSYYVRGQHEFNSSPLIPGIVTHICSNSEKVKKYVCPENGNLRIRVSCPECRKTDKKSVDTIIQGRNIISKCPIHGEFSVNIDTDSYQLEYNTPLRNLIRTILYMLESADKKTDYSWIRMTGSDYAGFYQEQTLYKTISALGYNIEKIPCIIYTPLITDSYGMKISKSSFKKENGYLFEFNKIKNYSSIVENYGKEGMILLYETVEEWLKDTKKFFCSYSLMYFDVIFKNYFS